MAHLNGQSIYPEGRHPMVVNRMDQFVNNLTSIRKLLERTSDPRRDVYAECGFPKSGDLTADYFRDKYDRDAIANRVVQLFPKETWQVQPKIYESEDPEHATPFEEAWDALPRNLRGKSWYKDEEGSPIWGMLKRADILSGIGHYGIILLGIDDGKMLNEPAEGLEYTSYIDKMFFPQGTDRQYTTPFGGPVEYPDSKMADSDPQVGAKGKIEKTVDQYATKPKITKLTGNAFGKPREQDDGKPPIDEEDPKAKDDQTDKSKDRFGLSPEAGGKGDNTEEVDATDQFGDDQEQQPVAPKRKLIFMRVYDESLAQITQWDSDPSSPRFGQPVMYRVQLFDPRNQQTGTGLTMASQAVHWSRVIHLADTEDVSDTFAPPRMKVVLNNILGLLKVYGGDPEAFWKNMMMRLFLETHPELGPDVDIDYAGLKDVMENMENGLQRWAALTGMSAKTVSPAVVDPTAHINAQIEAICIVLGCPVRVFKGSERGELASSQDDSAWNDRLRERQLNYLTPRVVIPFIDRLILLGVLPEPTETDKGNAEIKAQDLADQLPTDEEGFGGTVEDDPTSNAYMVLNAEGDVEAIVPKGGYSIEWPDLDSLGDKDKAAIAQTRTAAMSQYVSGQVGSLMAPMDYLTRELDYEEEEAETILQNATDHTAEQSQLQMDQQSQMIDQGLAPDPTNPDHFPDQGGDQFPPQDGGDNGDGRGDFPPSAAPGQNDFSDEQLNKILSNVARGWPTTNGFNPTKELQRIGKELARSSGAMPGYGQIFLKKNGSGEVWYVGGDGNEDWFGKLVKKRLSSVKGIDEVTYEAEAFPTRDGTWIQIYPKKKEWNKEKWEPISNLRNKTKVGDRVRVVDDDGNVFVTHGTVTYVNERTEVMEDNGSGGMYPNRFVKPLTNQQKPKDTSTLRPSIQVRGVDRRLTRVTNAEVEGVQVHTKVEYANTTKLREAPKSIPATNSSSQEMVREPDPLEEFSKLNKKTKGKWEPIPKKK